MTGKGRGTWRPYQEIMRRVEEVTDSGRESQRQNDGPTQQAMILRHMM
jgi:hypothetical protein